MIRKYFNSTCEISKGDVYTMKKRCLASLIFVIVLYFCTVASAESVREMLVNSKHMRLVYPVSDTETHVRIDTQIGTANMTDGFLSDLKEILQKTGTKVQVHKIETDMITGKKTVTWEDLKVESDGKFVDPTTGERIRWFDERIVTGYYKGPKLRLSGAFAITPFDEVQLGKPRWMKISHTDKQPFAYKISDGRRLDILSMPATGELFDVVPVLKNYSLGVHSYNANEVFTYLTGLCIRLNGRPTYIVPRYDKGGKPLGLHETSSSRELWDVMMDSQFGPKAWYFACSGSDKFVARGVWEKTGQFFHPYDLRIKFVAGRDLNGVKYTPLSSSK